MSLPYVPAEEKIIDVLKDIRDGVGGGDGGGGTDTVSDTIIENLDELNTTASSILATVSTVTPAAAINLGANISATGAWVPWPGGRGVAFVAGTFGGAVVSLETRWMAGGAVPMGAAAVFSANGGCNFELPVGSDIRMVVTGGSGISVSGTAARTMI